jgi:hypothetical protein
VRDRLYLLRNPIAAMRTTIFTGPKLISRVPDAGYALLQRNYLPVRASVISTTNDPTEVRRIWTEAGEYRV